MKLKVWGESSEQYYLRMVEGEGEITIHAVDGNGDVVPMGDLIRLNKRGVHRFPLVNPAVARALGLPLNGERQIAEC